MNYGYCKLNEDGTIKEYAPDTVRTRYGFVPKPRASHYLDAIDGPWLEIDHPDPGEASEGFHFEPTGIYREEDGKAVTLYEEVENPPPPPRRWTPLTVMRGLIKAGLWEQMTEGMSQTDMYEFIACQFISEDDPLFISKRDALYTVLGKDTVDAFLDSLETEP